MNVEALSAEARAYYMRIGRSYGSDRTLAQAAKTLQGWREHGAVLSAYGFAQEDAQALEAIIARLRAEGVERADLELDKKSNAVELLAYIKQGKQLRGRMRTLATGVSERLQRSSEPAKQQARAQLEEALDHTATSGAEPQRLIEQLVLLNGLFALPVFASTAAARGGEPLHEQLQRLIPALQSATDALEAVRATPERAARLDLLDGIIVELVRSARRAARAAANDLGRPELEAAFGLSELYDG